MDLETFADLATAWLIFFRREYPVRREMRTIVDAGANIGLFSLFAAVTAPAARVLALEPFPATYDRLSRNIRANSLHERVTCLPLALAGHNGTRVMDGRPTIGSQFRSLQPQENGTASVAVEAASLDSLLDGEALDRVDMLKLDIEGSEYEVVAGASDGALCRCAVIALEYHPGGDKEAMFDRLRGLGFRLEADRPALGGYGNAVLCRP
jgi:FkbM family methyltransferase